MTAPRTGPEPRASTREVVLEVHGLSKTYRSAGRGGTPKRANENLSLTVHAGEVVALLGPNGAGKSTFLRQVGGQLLPTAGEIRVAGVDMIASPREAKQFLSAIPQECQPISSLSAEEQVLGFGLIKGLPRAGARAEVRAILESVGLTSERGKVARELSGGYKRRLLIAIAIAGARPRLMLLDEPTTGLDPEARRAVWQVVHRLRAQGIGILLTTHYIEEAEYLADRVVIIHEGRFALEGSVGELRARLPYRGRIDLRDLDRLGPGPLRRVDELLRRSAVAFRSPAYLRLQVPDPFSADTLALLHELTELGVSATLSPASLEDAYLSVVGALEERSG
jgi:ABC-2 type transport system ATP-binding protein